jgi:hypothetical protein
VEGKGDEKGCVVVSVFDAAVGCCETGNRESVDGGWWRTKKPSYIRG